MRSLFMALSVAAVSIGCGGDIEGSWQSRDKLSNEQRNELDVGEDGTGDLTMYVELVEGEGLVKLKYDFDWADEGDDVYDLDLICKSGCADDSLNFSMDCDYLSDNDHIDCEAKKVYTDYGFFEFEVKEE